MWTRSDSSKPRLQCTVTVIWTCLLLRLINLDPILFSAELIWKNSEAIHNSSLPSGSLSHCKRIG